MPATCSAWGCEYRRDREANTTYKGKDGKELFKWVSAVSKTSLSAAWIKNVKRADNLPQDKNFPYVGSILLLIVLNETFMPSTNLASQIKSNKIKDDAVPTIFQFKKKTPARMNFETRKKKAEERKMVDDLLEETILSSDDPGKSMHVEEIP